MWPAVGQLDRLLRDGAAAALAHPWDDERRERACRRAAVYAAVSIEPRVLGRHDRVYENRRDVFQVNPRVVVIGRAHVSQRNPSPVDDGERRRRMGERAVVERRPRSSAADSRHQQA